MFEVVEGLNNMFTISLSHWFLIQVCAVDFICVFIVFYFSFIVVLVWFRLFPLNHGINGI